MYLWMKQALIPSIKRACDDKLEFYRKLYKRDNIIDSLKTEIKGWIDKNEVYLKDIEELSQYSEIQNQSAIIMPEPSVEGLTA